MWMIANVPFGANAGDDLGFLGGGWLIRSTLDEYAYNGSQYHEHRDERPVHW